MVVMIAVDHSNLELLLCVVFDLLLGEILVLEAGPCMSHTALKQLSPSYGGLIVDEFLVCLRVSGVIKSDSVKLCVDAIQENVD
jgi:hypothetical protein